MHSLDSVAFEDTMIVVPQCLIKSLIFGVPCIRMSNLPSALKTLPAQLFAGFCVVLHVVWYVSFHGQPVDKLESYLVSVISKLCCKPCVMTVTVLKNVVNM